MNREVIKLSNQQWCDLVFEDYLEINEVEIPIEVKERNHEGGHRHTESYNLVFKRLSDNKYFRVEYETSVKDSMGWKECNYGSTEATEVFPQVVETIIYT